MNKLKFLLVSTVLFALVFTLMPTVSEAAVAEFSFTTSSMYFSEPSVYTIKFLAPAGLQIGRIGVSFANPYVDLSDASLTVSGISGGTAIVDYDPGLSGNWDLEYKLSSVVTMESDTWIELLVTGAINPPGPNGSVGFDYISVYDSTTVAHNAWGPYNDEHGTNLRGPTNYYIYLKDKNAPAPTPTPTPTPTQVPATPPTITLTTDQSTVPYAGATTIRWSSTNATSCSASNSWSGSKPTSGTQTTGNLISEKTFTLTCTGAGGSVSKNATVYVTPQTTIPVTTGKGPTTNAAVKATTDKTPKTLSQIIYTEYFYWVGSLTTVLADISNPTNVENFTLDVYQEGMIVWTEAIDLSTTESLSALDKVDEYVTIDSWFFYIAWEFWTIWEVPVDVTLHNSEVVAAPVIYKDGKPADVGQVKLVENDKGGTDIKFTVDEGGKYEVKHAIVLDEKNSAVDTKNETYTLSGYVTDPKAEVTLTVNGVVSPEKITVNQETGRFEKVLDVILGNNSIALAATSASGEVLPASLNVNRTEGSNLWPYIIGLLLLVIIVTIISLKLRKNP